MIAIIDDSLPKTNEFSPFNQQYQWIRNHYLFKIVVTTIEKVLYLFVTIVEIIESIKKMSRFELTTPSSPIALESDHTSITIAWSKVDGATAYNLEMRSDDAADWTSLSSSLQACQAKKKNLVFGSQYQFRVRYRLDGEAWSPYSNNSEYYSIPAPTSTIMSAPSFVTNDSSSITISRAAVEGVAQYRIRFRLATSIECQ